MPLSPTTKKHLAVQGTATPQPPRGLSRGNPVTERLGPLRAQKVTSSKYSGRRAHPLSSERTRVQQQTSSRTSRKTVVVSRSGQQAESQKKPVWGGRPTNKSPKAIVKVVSTCVAKLGAGTSKPAASREPLVQATTPHIMHVSVDASCFYIDATASPHGVNVQDSKLSKTALSSVQGRYLCTPSQRDVSRPSADLHRAPRRRRISICMRRPQPPQDCTTTTPSSCDRPIRPLIPCIQRGSPLTPPSHDVHVRIHVPRDVSRPSSVNDDPQGEALWRSRGAKFAVFTGPEDTDSNATHVPTHMTDGLRAALQYPPRATAILQSQRHRIACPSSRSRRPKEFKFSSVFPSSLLRETTPVPVMTPCHLRQVLNFLDIAI